MFLYLGEDTCIYDNDIIGIFDIENTSVSKHTKNFLAVSEKKHIVNTVSYEMPKSFIVCSNLKNNIETVFISQISVATLKKRANKP